MARTGLAAHAFASAADVGEVEAGMLAQQRAANPQVRTYANLMVATHSNALQTREAWMAQLGMGMESGMRMQGMSASTGTGTGTGMESGSTMGMTGGTATAPMSPAMMEQMRGMLMGHPTSRPLMEQNMPPMQMLQGLTGAQFDRAYVEQQIAAHQTVLQGIDSMLAAPAQMPSPKVLGMLQAMRASVAGHLQTAQRLRGSP